MNFLRRVYNLLQAEERKKVFKIAIAVFFSALLDFASLTALFPVLYFLLENRQKDEAALFFSILAIIIILIKCVLTTLSARYQNQYLLSFYKRLSFSLFSSYYNRGVLFIREQGSNQLGYRINEICYAFSNSLLAPLCRISGDILLIVLVTSALLIWNGTTVLLLFATFVPFMCFYFFGVRKQVRKYGSDDINVKKDQARVVSDTFRGYVELEVNGAFPALQHIFLRGMDKISKNRMKLDMLLRLPLFLSEFSVIVGLAMLIFFGKGDLRMMIGIFAVASFRLLPAFRTILTGWTQIQNSICCLDIIEEGLNGYQDNTVQEKQEISFYREICIENITYSYPNGKQIFKNFNCRINKGEYVGFCGTSGVGKSTLFNLLIGLIESQSGETKIDGVALTRKTRASWMKQIGYVPQEVFIFNGNLAENIALECLEGKEIDYKQIYDVLEKAGLSKWVKSMPEGVNTVLSEAGGKLSGGEKQRIGIARALYKRVSVLLLDEATSALDNITENEINHTFQKLKENNKELTILSIAHRESSLRFCDRIITIKNE